MLTSAPRKSTNRARSKESGSCSPRDAWHCNSNAHTRARVKRALPRCRAGPAGRSRAGTHVRVGARGALLDRPRGHVAASQWRGPRRLAAQTRGAWLAPGFVRFRRPGGRFSFQKSTTAHVSLGLALVLAPGARFFSGFHYRSVEGRVTDAREVGCMQGGSWNVRKLLGIFLAPLPL